MSETHHWTRQIAALTMTDAENDKDIYYRYEKCKYDVGEKITAKTDHIDSLKGRQLETEQFFRAHSNGALRKQGVYLYKDATHTRTQWLQQANMRERYLYKVRAPTIRLKADVKHFNDCQSNELTDEERAQRRDDYFAGRNSNEPTIEYITDEAEVLAVLGTPQDQKRIRKEQDDAKIRQKHAYSIEDTLEGDDGTEG
jgi:hypothetical protein